MRTTFHYPESPHGRTYADVITKISRMDSLPNYLSYGASRARSSPNNLVKVTLISTPSQFSTCSRAAGILILSDEGKVWLLHILLSYRTSFYISVVVTITCDRRKRSFSNTTISYIIIHTAVFPSFQRFHVDAGAKGINMLPFSFLKMEKTIISTQKYQDTGGRDLSKHKILLV